MTSKTGVGPRIREFREGKGLTRVQLAEALGVKPSMIQNIEDQKQKTSDTFIIDFISKFNVPIEWLFAPSDATGIKVALPDAGVPWAGDVKLEGKDFSLIRRFDVRASAGNGLFPDPDHQEGAVAFQTRWLNNQGINERLAGVVEVSGDSMLPTIKDGALALVHLAEMRVSREGIYAFTRDGGVYVKRIVPLRFGPDDRAQSMVLISDNKTYPAEVVEDEDLNQIRIAGRVRWVIDPV